LFTIRILEVKANPAWWFILPLAVWSIYTLDHLLDGVAKKGQSTIYRHYFHYKYRKVLILAVLVTATISIFLSLLFLEKQIFIKGLLLSGFVVFYFVLVYFQDRLKIKYIHKEAFIAIVYLTGILLAPMVWLKGVLQFQYLLIFGILLVLVWTESVMVSFYDYYHDKSDQLNSFTLVYGIERTRKILIIVHLTLAIILFLTVLVCNNKVMLGAVIIESVMNFCLLALIFFPKTLAENNLFRWIGESVFLLPVFIVLF